MRKIHGIVATALVVGLAATVAFGLDGEPKKANKFQATVINASGTCTSPTESTGGSLAAPACPATDAAVCTFGDKGSGKVQAKAKDDIYLSVKVGGLENCPDGTILQARATYSATTNDCTVSSRCTTITVPNFPIPGATCTVSKGKCQIKTSLNTLIPGAVTPGENTAVKLGDVGLVTGTSQVAVAGLLVP
jgi:hypothetical protein